MEGGLKRKDTTKGPPLRILSLGGSSSPQIPFPVRIKQSSVLYQTKLSAPCFETKPNTA